MARAQRKEEILKSELPPTLPLMALRSTIVYPLGTIAVQMGAPENLALLRSHEDSGLIVELGAWVVRVPFQTRLPSRQSVRSSG